MKQRKQYKTMAAKDGKITMENYDYFSGMKKQSKKTESCKGGKSMRTSSRLQEIKAPEDAAPFFICSCLFFFVGLLIFNPSGGKKSSLWNFQHPFPSWELVIGG